MKRRRTNLLQNHSDGFNPTSPQMWTIFFTVPIMAYIMKGGENMNGGLSKSFKKMGTLDFIRNPSIFFIT